jgi:hypothetical protein
MRKQGKFLLFEEPSEFTAWLDGAAVSRRVVLVQNHHTWLPDYTTFHGSNHFGLLQGMEASHIERGFDEIAQNLTTFPDGSVAVCRSLDKIPAGIKGANTGGICIENLGNFDAGRDPMTTAHREAIVRVNAALCRKFTLAPDTDSIVYHHWYDLITGLRTNGTGSTKTCPGTAFFGGNTVADAAANFVPLVARALAGLPSAVAPRPVAIGAFAVNAVSLNVREAPNGSAKVVKRLLRGVHVEAFRQSGDWMCVHATESHWASSRYLLAL